MSNVPTRPENELPVRVYSSEGNFGIKKIFRSIYREFPAAHALGFRFAERNIRSRYRQSIFGMLWAFLPPIATSFIWIILYNTKIVSLSDVGVPYPLFAITGTTLWAVFANAVMMPLQVMQTNRAILVKLNFPREALMINAFYETSFNALVSFVIILVELVVFRVVPGWEALLFFPAVFLLIILGLAIGMLLLPVSLLYRDVQFVLPSLLQFAMYLTPVVYAKPIYQGLARVLAYNPVTPLLSGGRAWLLGLDHLMPDMHFWTIGGVSVLLLLFGIILQRITIEILIERMGS